jgi:hypothetical protein
MHGRMPRLHVDLELADPATGAVTVRRDVPMTKANRDLVWRSGAGERGD